MSNTKKTNDIDDIIENKINTDAIEKLRIELKEKNAKTVWGSWLNKENVTIEDIKMALDWYIYPRSAAVDISDIKHDFEFFINTEGINRVKIIDNKTKKEEIIVDIFGKPWSVSEELGNALESALKHTQSFYLNEYGMLVSRKPKGEKAMYDLVGEK